jgi:hypothetical protein
VFTTASAFSTNANLHFSRSSPFLELSQIIISDFSVPGTRGRAPTRRRQIDVSLDSFTEAWPPPPPLVSPSSAPRQPLVSPSSAAAAVAAAIAIAEVTVSRFFIIRVRGRRALGDPDKSGAALSKELERAARLFCALVPSPARETPKSSSSRAREEKAAPGSRRLSWRQRLREKSPVAGGAKKFRPVTAARETFYLRISWRPTFFSLLLLLPLLPPPPPSPPPPPPLFFFHGTARVA